MDRATGSAARPHPQLIDPEDPKHSARLSFIAFATAAQWEHDLATFRAACDEVLVSQLGDLLPDDRSLIAPSLWVQAAEKIATLPMDKLAKRKVRHGCGDRPDVVRARAHKQRREAVQRTNPFRPGQWVTPRNWRSTRYIRWAKSIIAVDGLELVLFGNKRVLAVDMREATQAEKDAYFASVKGSKSR